MAYATISAVLLVASAGAPTDLAAAADELRDLKAEQDRLAGRIEALETLLGSATSATSPTGATSQSAPPPVAVIPSATPELSAPAATVIRDGELRFYGVAQATASWDLAGYNSYNLDADQSVFGFEYTRDLNGVPVRAVFEITPQYELESHRAFVEIGDFRVGRDISALVNDVYVAEGVQQANYTGQERTLQVAPGLFQPVVNVVQARFGGFVFSAEAPVSRAGGQSPYALVGRYDGHHDAIDWTVGFVANQYGGYEPKFGYGATVGGKITFGRDAIRGSFVTGSAIGDALDGLGIDAASPTGEPIEVSIGRLSIRHWWTDTIRSNAYYGFTGTSRWNTYGTEEITASGGTSRYRVTTAQERDSSSVGLNLLWSPSPGLDIGIEGSWGEMTYGQATTYQLISGPDQYLVNTDYSGESSSDRAFMFVRARY